MISIAICCGGAAEPLPEVVAAFGGAARIIRAERLWQARQRALAECTTPVIAFVDGDVLVGEGWLEALERAWDRAGMEIAAIGGPVRGPARPGVVAELLELGEEEHDEDPLERTLIGGNLSFRRTALRGAGGFGPTVDGRDGRDWFAEEHEAQRQLGHWGWLVRYSPALAAERIPGWEGAPSGGRFRYGVRTGIARSRSAGTAARAFAPAAAGVVAAVAAGRHDRARERAARAAENAGVLLAPLAAPAAWRQRGQQPEHARPGRATERRVPRGATAPVILLYHRIASDPVDPLGLCVSPRHFTEQVEALAELVQIVSLDELAAMHAAGSRAYGVAAITFDDGYADNLAALEALDLPVTLFAATGPIASGERFFWDEAARMLLGASDCPRVLTLRLEDEAHALRTGSVRERREALQRFHRLVQPRAPETIADALAQLRAWAGNVADQGPPDATRLMTVDELRRLAASGVTIGAHTRRHLNLAHQAADVVRSEVAGSRADVESWLGEAPPGFSYPFGIPRHDVDERARRAVADAGYDYAVVNQPVPVEARHDRFALPRMFAPDLAGGEFRDWLRSNLTAA